MSQSTKLQTSSFNMNVAEDVAKFMQIMQLPIGVKPNADAGHWPTLVKEEAEETWEAWQRLNNMLEQNETCEGLHPQEAIDEVTAEFLDGIVDQIYVLTGWAHTCGLPLAEAWQRVQAANMAKAGPDGTVLRRKDGKILKPQGWTPPNIVELIRIARG